MDLKVVPFYGTDQALLRRHHWSIPSLGAAKAHSMEIRIQSALLLYAITTQTMKEFSSLRLVDSVTHTVSIPQDKINKTIAAAKAALEKGTPTLLEAQEFAGLFTFCASAVQLGFVFCRWM